MTVWMVFVSVSERTAGPARITARWIDSQWAKEESAVDRKREVEASMRVFGCYRIPGTDAGVSAEIICGSIADTAIVEKVPEAE